MQHFDSIEKADLTVSWLTIGNFDGVHLGHRDLIKRLVKGAHQRSILAAVLTFHPHPAAVLGRRMGAFYLNSPAEKAALLEELGVDVVINQKFDHKLADTPAEKFVSNLHEHLHFQSLWIGHDFALGRGREGNESALREYGRRLGFGVEAIEPYSFEGEIVSSSRIRRLITDGEINIANRLMGRNYSLTGQVIPGDQRGRTIGIPTANLLINDDRLVPANGVYACRACLEDKPGKPIYKAAVNIGFRPTFDGKTTYQHIEGHLLDFDGDLYGERVRLEFVSRLRGEHKFKSIPELVDQIQHDIASTRLLA